MKALYMSFFPFFLTLRCIVKVVISKEKQKADVYNLLNSRVDDAVKKGYSFLVRLQKIFFEQERKQKRQSQRQKQPRNTSVK